MKEIELANIIDIELIEKSQKGDENALSTLCKKYEPLILKYAKNSHVATLGEDVKSELWLIFLEAVYKYTPTKGIPVAGYLQSAIKYGQWNLFKKYRKQWQHEQSLSNDLSPTSNSDNIQNLDKFFISSENLEEEFIERFTCSEQYKLLREALKHLTVAEKELLLRHYIHQESLAKIAREKGYSRQRLQYQHAQILKKLQTFKKI